MDNLPKYYTTLFNAVSDALEAMDQMNWGIAKQLLMQGQLQAEEAFSVQPENET